MAASELFPGESGVRQQVMDAGWSETVGNGWALVFEDPGNENLTLRVYPSFFLEGVTPAYLIVETLEGDPQRGPLGLQLWVSTQGGRVPAPEEAVGLLARDGWRRLSGWGAYARGPYGRGGVRSRRQGEEAGA